MRPGNSSIQFEPRRRRERDIMKNLFARFIKEEEGQDLIEYALLTALISVLLVTALGTLRTAISNAFAAAGTALS
jgi:pilus assembly protein Flp/PilA